MGKLATSVVAQSRFNIHCQKESGCTIHNQVSLQGLVIFIPSGRTTIKKLSSFIFPLLES